MSLYDPNWWDKLTGMDWGTDRSLRNSVEAYKYFSDLMYMTANKLGWNAESVNYIVRKAYSWSGNADLSTNAIYFWTGVQDNFMTWVKESGWNIQDFPKWKDIIKLIDMNTDGALSYKKVKENADKIFQNTAIATTGDLWHLWQTNVPKELRWIAYGVGGLLVFSYTYPVIRMVGRTARMIIPKKKES